MHKLQFVWYRTFSCQKLNCRDLFLYAKVEGLGDNVLSMHLSYVATPYLSFKGQFCLNVMSVYHQVSCIYLYVTSSINRPAL